MAETIQKAKAPAKPKSTAKKEAAAPIEVQVEAPKAAAPAKRGAKPRVKSPTAAKVTEKVPSTGPRKVAAKPKPLPVETHPATPSRDEVARLAHRLWKERGGHHGAHEQDWFRAEQELRGRAS